jgi:energy-coupling factor transport system permease protein
MTSALVLAGLGAICIGLYGVLDGTSPVWLGLPMLALGVAAGAAGMWLGGRRIRRTAYRPDVWRLPETVVAATGLTSALLMIAAGQLDPAALHPSLVPLAWPEFVPLATAGILIAVLPAWVAPPVRLAVRVPGDAATVASRPGAPVS